MQKRNHCTAENKSAQGGCCEPEGARTTELGANSHKEAATPDMPRVHEGKRDQYGEEITHRAPVCVKACGYEFT